MDSPDSLWTQTVIIVILTVINAFFAMSEIAYVSVNQNKIKNLAEEGDERAKRVMQLLDRSDNFLATIQVAITLAGFLSSASAATSFARVLADWMPSIPGIETLSIVLVTIILSYLTLVFGELFPKQLALQMPEKIALATSGIISGTQTLFRPFVALLSASTTLLKRIVPVEFSEEDEKFTRDEMRAILSESRKDGSIDLAEFTMMEGVLSLDNKLAREIMRPRTDTQMIDIEGDYRENMAELLSSPYSRIPLYESDKDNVIGIIHMKHLLKEASQSGFDTMNLREIATEPMIVPSTMYVDDLLVEFRRQQNHMAILKDEYGGMEGIVTLEDILEEIVGEIEDETDLVTSRDVRKIDDVNYYVSGGISIEKFNNYFDLKIESDEVDTIAGLIIYYMGYVPSDEERVSLRVDDYVLTTSHIDNGRIRGVHVTLDEAHSLETDYDMAQDPSQYEASRHDSWEEDSEGQAPAEE